MLSFLGLMWAFYYTIPGAIPPFQAIFHGALHMTTILFAWELGQSLGHITTLLPLALQLRQRGHEVVFVVRDTHSAELLLAPHDIRWYQAPVSMQAKIPGQRAAHNYAEILLNCGYREPVALAGLIAGWQHLFAVLKPALTVFEHSPTALLASRGLAMKRVITGMGFFVPPLVTPFPDLYARNPLAPAELLASEALALANINLALARRKLPALSALTDMFEADQTCLASFAELDHYRERAPCQYWGPQYVDDTGAEITWPDNGRKRIFMYLRPHLGGFERLLSQLRLLECEALILAPGIAPALMARYHSKHIRFSQSLHKLASLAGQCDLVVSYGGLGTLAPCLLAGIPLLLLPQYQEQRMMAQRVVELGAALAIERVTPATDFVAPLRQLLTHPHYREAAQAFAAKHAGYHPAQAAQRMADEVAALLPAAPH